MPTSQQHSNTGSRPQVPAVAPTRARLKPRVLVAAGGTAGHLAPALAVADNLRECGCEVTFMVSRGRADERIVVERGYGYDAFAISGLPRSLGVGQVKAIGRALAAVPRCLRIIGRRRPDVVLAGGGYVSAPAAVAAWLWRVPVVVTEADARLGLANRIAARFARRLCTAYPLPQYRLRQTVTGRPTDPAFTGADGAAARARWGIGEGEVALAVVGGSGGATHLNEAVFEAFAHDTGLQVGGPGHLDPAGGEEELPGRPLHVLHVTGRRDYGGFARRASEVAGGVDRAGGRYRVIEYCDDMPGLFAAADLVISRAGGSIFELAAVGRATVLAPWAGAAGDHQRRNARFFSLRGAALVVEDAELTPGRVRQIVLELLAPGGDSRRGRLARAMHGLARPRAASDIAAIVTSIGAAQLRRRQP